MKFSEILQITEANNDNSFSFLRYAIFGSVQQLMYNGITSIPELFHYHRECLAFIRTEHIDIPVIRFVLTYAGTIVVKDIAIRETDDGMGIRMVDIVVILICLLGSKL